MRGLGVIVAALIFCETAGANDAHIAQERKLGDRGLELTIATPAFTAPVPVQVYLPKGYDPNSATRWPVTFYLAGTNHDEKAFADQYDGEKLTRDFPSIVVAPKGDSGYWSDWF